LPDSKFYSPGQKGSPEEAQPEDQIPEAMPQPEMELEPEAPEIPRASEVPEPPEPAVERHPMESPTFGTHNRAARSGGVRQEAEDIFVMPGESLAKYTGSDREEDRAQGRKETSRGERPAPNREQPHAEDLPEASPAAPGPSEAERSLSAVRERIREIEARAKATFDSYQMAPDRVIAEPALEAAPEAPVEELQPVAEAPAEAAEALPSHEFAEAAAAVETAEPEAGAEPAEAAEIGETGEAAADEAPSAEGAETEEPIVEPEGPEPARIPTSLTAALREQGPRYLHRVSRRMRRKGREVRGPIAETARPGAPESNPVEQRTPPPRAAAEARTEARSEKSSTPSISDLLKEGQEIIVQIAKEPLGAKGARITSHIALPGRFLVYMPTVDHIGVSRKIPGEDERQRLKRILQNNHSGIPGGFIVRTAGEGHSEEELRADMLFLYNLWLDMRQKAERRPAPLLIHHDLNVVERILRDQLTTSFKSIWVDNEEVYESVLGFVQRFQPALVSRVKLYTRPTPIFDEFNITAELEKALRPKVWLKSGGHIVINQTEALVAIDINTGKYVGKSNRLEDTIVKTNTDAIKEIVRQIRLRDLGGIIVVDFIDMDERKNRQKVMQALEEAMRADRAPYKILQFNDFGLVAITRKRVKQSLERTLCTPCPYCDSAGYVKSPQTVVGEILIEAQKIARAVDGKDVMLRVNPEVAKLLKSNQNSYLQELEEILGRTVIVKSDQQLHQEKFDLA